MIRRSGSTPKIESDIDKSTDTSDTVWNKQFYSLYIAPVTDSPQAIVDFTLAASKKGAKDAKLLYDLVVAEMDVAIARFNVTLSLITKERGARPK